MNIYTVNPSKQYINIHKVAHQVCTPAWITGLGDPEQAVGMMVNMSTHPETPSDLHWQLY